MNKGHFVLTILIVFSVFFTNAFSQLNMEIHVGPSIPLSNFASSEINENDAGGAVNGLNIGLQLTQSLPIRNFSFFAGIDFMYNKIDSKLKSEFAKKSKEEMSDAKLFYSSFDYDVSSFNYINIPVSVGLLFSKMLNENVSLNVETGLACNFLKITDMETIVNRDITIIEDEKLKTKFDLTPNLGYRIGCGLILSKKVSFSLKYFALGEHNAIAELSSEYSTSEWQRKLKVDILSLTVGLIL